jgi:hypothetical protein
LNCDSEWVVVRDVRPRVTLGDAEVRQQQSDRLRGHRRAAVGVHGELAWGDALSLAAHGDQLLGEPCEFAVRQHPAHHVAAEDIEHHVEVVVRPLRGAQ